MTELISTEQALRYRSEYRKARTRVQQLLAEKALLEAALVGMRETAENVLRTLEVTERKHEKERRDESV